MLFSIPLLHGSSHRRVGLCVSILMTFSLMFSMSSPALVLSMGDIAPDFEAHLSTDETIGFYEWMDREGGLYTIVFSYPHDYLPVATTELAEVEKRITSFRKKGVNIIALSVDDVNAHKHWLKDVAALAGVDNVSFPVIADQEFNVSKLFHMLPEDAENSEARTTVENYTVRAVFVINNDTRKIEALMTYPTKVGRSLDEIERIMDALLTIHTHKHRVATRSGWVRGDNLILNPNLTIEQASQDYGQLFIINLPSSSSGFPDYLREVPFWQTLNKDRVNADLSECGPNSFVSPCHQCARDGAKCFECSAFTTYDSCESHGARTCAQIVPCGPWCPSAPVCDPDK